MKDHVIALAEAVLAELQQTSPKRVFASRKGICGFNNHHGGNNEGFRRLEDGSVIFEVWKSPSDILSPTYRQHSLPADLQIKAQAMLDSLC